MAGYKSKWGELIMGKAKVLKLVKPKPNKEAVDYLKTVLKEAKEGKIVGVGVICVSPNGDFDTGWTSGIRKNSFLGAATFLTQRILREMIE